MYFKSSPKAIFFLTLIFILCSLARILNFNITFSLSTDISQPYEIADQIIHKKGIILLGYGHPRLDIVPPTFHLLVTFLYYILRNEYLVTFVIVIISILTLFTLYKLLKMISRTKSALLACLLFATSYDLTYYSVYTPHPLVTLSLVLSFYFLFASKKYENVKFLIFSLFFFLTGMMYITTYLFIPLYLFYLLYFLFSFKKNQDDNIFLIIFQIILLFILFFLSVIYFHFLSNFKQFTELSIQTLGQDNYLNFNLNSIISLFLLNLKHFSNSFFLSANPILNFILFSFFMFLFFVTIFIKSHNFSYYLFIGIAFISGLFFSALNPNKVDLPHLLVFIPLYIILISIGITESLGNIRNKIVLIPVFIGLMLYIYNNQKNFVGNLFAKSQIKNHQQKVADFIKNTVQYNSYSLITYTPDDKSGYYSLEYIYALKKLQVYHMPIRMDYRGELHYSFNSQKKNIFLICKNYPNNIILLNECLNFFRTKYDKKEFTIKQKIDNVEIFLFTNKI